MNIFIYLLPLFIFSQLHTYRFYHAVSLLRPRPVPQVQGATNPSQLPSPALSPSPSPRSDSAGPTPSPTIDPTSLPSVLSIKPASQAGGPSAGTPQPGGISEGDLWNALVDYRASHGRTSIIREENLCAYARKRVAEHQGRTDLDNHSGFQRDADNGALFSETGDFLQLGEVLAYLPGATTATQVLEWGWDSSSAHREGLLSDESTHACIVGTAPFYAGILGHR